MATSPKTLGVIERRASHRASAAWNDRARSLIWTSVLFETMGAVGDFAAFQVVIEQRASTTANLRLKRRRNLHAAQHLIIDDSSRRRAASGTSLVVCPVIE